MTMRHAMPGYRGLLLLIVCQISACGGGGGGGSGSAPPPVSFCTTQSFTDPATSPYILPWNAGAGYTMFQGNCSTLGGHKETFAYDFDMGMGDPIFASRAGRVILVNDQFSDDDHIEGHENNVFVEHADNTVVRYTHLMQASAVVDVGQQVVQGDLLGLAGNSGNSSGPHLHFQAFRDRTSFGKSNAVPITFSNAIGQTAASGALLEGVLYTAGGQNTLLGVSKN
ncbi:MAG: M23 family metallopeptidase [Gammaproteobacteria bacterium]